MFLGTLASFLMALLSSSAALTASDAWQLRRSYFACDKVELDAVGLEAEALQKAVSGSEGRFAEAGQELGAGLSGGARPRFILRTGAAFPSPLDETLERLGFIREAEGFRFFGRFFERAEDGFVATFEDPVRPGLPVTIWYANSPAALAAYATGLAPSTRPGFRAFRGGELELSGALASNGTVYTAELIDRRRAWTERFNTDRRIALRGFTCRVPKLFEVDRALAYLDVLAAARARALTWADETGQAARAPVAAIGDTRVVVHGHVEEMLTLIGGAEISMVNSVTGTVHVLLSAGLPDDHGAAVAESAVRRLLGPPAAAWLGPAAGVSAAGAWWGRELDPLVARLVAAGVVPDLAELLSPAPGHFLSPHVQRPLLGLLFLHLAELHGHAFLRELWTGEIELDTAAEEPAWQARLAELARAPKRPVQRLEAGTWRAGCELVPGEVGYGSRAVTESLGGLADTGATAVSVRSFVYRDRPEPLLPGQLHPPLVAARDGDLVVASAAAAARARGFELGLEMHLLVSSQGGYTADLSLSDLARCRSFFDDYEPFLVHEALLAELLSADRFSLGTGLGNATMASAVAGQDELKVERWRRLIKTARALFDGQVIYTAGSLYEAERLLFADQLDVLALELFPALEGSKDSPDYGPRQAPDENRLAKRLQGQLVRAAELAESRGQSLWLGGLGFASTREAWLRTDVPRGRTSPATQLLLYRALSTAIARLERRCPGVLVGLQLWNWSSYPAAGGLADRGYTPQGKPAAELLPRLFASPRSE